MFNDFTTLIAHAISTWLPQDEQQTLTKHLGMPAKQYMYSKITSALLIIIGESNPGHNGGRRALSPLRQLYSRVCVCLYLSILVCVWLYLYLKCLAL